MGILNLPSSRLHPYSHLSHNCKVKIHHSFTFVFGKLGQDSPFGKINWVKIHRAPQESQAQIHHAPYEIRSRFTISTGYFSSRFTIVSLMYIECMLFFTIQHSEDLQLDSRGQRKCYKKSIFIQMQTKIHTSLKRFMIYIGLFIYDCTIQPII